MTLQERMIQAYLRQADLPPAEKGKLKLFLILLDETYKEDGERIATASGLAMTGDGMTTPLRVVEDADPYRQDRTGQDRTPAPETPATTFSSGDYGAKDADCHVAAAPRNDGEGEEKPKPVDPLAGKAASEVPAKRSSGKAPGEEGEKTKAPDPLAEPLLKALEKAGLSLEEAAAEKYIGVRASVLQKVLEGEPIRKDSREKISRWVQGVGIAVTAGI